MLRCLVVVLILCSAVLAQEGSDTDEKLAWAGKAAELKVSKRLIVLVVPTKT